MSTMQFLDAVLPQQGNRIVVAIHPDRPHAPVQRCINNTQDITKFGLQYEAQGYDVYVAIGGYKDPGNREAHNAQWHRCLRLDLDVNKPGEANPKKFANKNEAINEFAKFMLALDLPGPLVVDSGGGYHIYWPFDRDLPLTDWLPLALRLKQACEDRGFLADPSVTKDAARILRLPGTTNQKPHLNGAVAAVKSFGGPALDPAVFDAKLPQLHAAQAQVPAALMTRAQMQQSPLQTPPAPYDIREVVNECLVLNDMARTGGAGYDQKEWYLMVGAVKQSMHTEQEKYAAAYNMSKGWSKNGKVFDVADLNQMWNRPDERRPFSCREMAANPKASTICKGCPHFANPLPSVSRLGTNQYIQDKLKAQQAAQPQAAYTNGLPTSGPFVLMPNGVAKVVDGKLSLDHHLSVVSGKPCKRVVHKGKPSDVPLLGPYTIKEADQSVSKTHGALTTLVIGRPGTDGDVTVKLDSTQSTSADAMTKAFKDASVHIHRNQAINFIVYMATFLAELQNLKATSHSVAQCGWDGGDFTLGLTTYRHKATPRTSRSADPLLEEYAVTGDKAKWDRAFNIILNSGADRQMLLALGIATPLMAFSKLNAVIVHMLSESGTGKSTTADMISSIWGNPEKLRMSVNDTTNAQENQAAITGSLPLVLDEMTQLDGKAVLQRVHAFTAGREKQRLTQNGKANRGDLFWNFLVFCSSNTSMVGRLLDNDSTDSGGVARVFEVALSDLPMSEDQQYKNKSVLSDMFDNYGWLGQRLAQYYADGSLDGWRQLVAKKIAEWDSTLGAGGAGRFRSTVGALAEIGAMLGRDMGYAFDVGAVIEEVKRQAGVQHKQVKEQRLTPEDFIYNYLKDNRFNMVVYRSGQRGFRNQYSTGPCTGEQHYNADGSITYVIREADFRTYVKQQHGEWSVVSKHPSLQPRDRMYLQNSDEPAHKYKCFIISYAANQTLQAVPSNTTNIATGGP